MNPRHRVVIVGASLAGLRTAENLRRRGCENPITLIGAEAEAPYDRVPLSKALLTDDEFDGERLRLLAPDELAALDLDLRLGNSATQLDTENRALTLADGTRVGYHVLVIATGAEPLRLPGEDDAAPIRYLRTIQDGLALRATLRATSHLAVVGGGLIGCEVAAAAHDRADVTVLTAGRGLCAALGPIVSQHVTDLHRAHGVAITRQAGAVWTRRIADGIAIRTTTGHELRADLAVAGVGIRPAILWLQSSRVDVDVGVLCDARGRTSVPDVYAVGDVAQPEGATRPLGHWQAAVDQAAATAACIVGDAAQSVQPLPYFWTDQYGQRIQVLGDPTIATSTRIVAGTPGEPGLAVLFGRGNEAVAAIAVAAPREFVALRRLMQSTDDYSELTASAGQLASALA